MKPGVLSQFSDHADILSFRVCQGESVFMLLQVMQLSASDTSLHSSCQHQASTHRSSLLCWCKGRLFKDNLINNKYLLDYPPPPLLPNSRRLLHSAINAKWAGRRNNALSELLRGWGRRTNWRREVSSERAKGKDSWPCLPVNSSYVKGIRFFLYFVDTLSTSAACLSALLCRAGSL